MSQCNINIKEYLFKHKYYKIINVSAYFVIFIQIKENFMKMHRYKRIRESY